MGYGVMTMRVETACFDQPGPVCAYGQNQLGGTQKAKRCASERIGDGQVMRPRMATKPAEAEGAGEIEIKQQEREEEEKMIGLLCTFTRKHARAASGGPAEEPKIKAAI